MMGEPPCNLECKQKPKEPEIREFVGPVKIVLMEPSKRYYTCKKWLAAMLSLANVLLVTNFLIVFFFVLSFKLELINNLHVYLCTIGYQFLLFTGVLMMNSLFGPAMPMMQKDKWRQHLICQMSGFSIGFVGFLLLYFGSHSFKDFFKTWHAEFGIFTVFVSIVTVCLGAATLFIRGDGWTPYLLKLFHIFIATKVIFNSSLCFVTGIVRPTFLEWLPLADMHLFMISFCAVYTFIVFFSNYTHLFWKLG